MAFDINRILIADDDERPRQLLRHYLQSWGFFVTECADGAEAAAHLEAPNAPSLAIIDWMMPGMEGVEVCRRIRNLPRQRAYTYIILVTGNNDAAAGLQAGADDFVSKPYNIDELRARVAVGQRVLGLERRLAEHITLLRDALDQVVALPGPPPVLCFCPQCHRARGSEEQSWQQIGALLEEHFGTHSVPEICPDCREQIRLRDERENPLRRAGGSNY